MSGGRPCDRRARTKGLLLPLNAGNIVTWLRGFGKCRRRGRTRAGKRYFSEAAKRWMREQASSSNSSEVA